MIWKSNLTKPDRARHTCARKESRNSANFVFQGPRLSNSLSGWFLLLSVSRVGRWNGPGCNDSFEFVTVTDNHVGDAMYRASLSDVVCVVLLYPWLGLRGGGERGCARTRHRGVQQWPGTTRKPRNQIKSLSDSTRNLARGQQGACVWSGSCSRGPGRRGVVLICMGRTKSNNGRCKVVRDKF